MRVLLAVASKHGATREIAEHIKGAIEGEGHDVTLTAANEADGLEQYDALIVGSAVYAGHWMKEAKEFAESIRSLQPTPPTWLFSSGPIGDPPKPEEDPVDVAQIVAAVRAEDHRVFAGRLDKSRLNFGERAIVTALRAPEGDFRDWDQIEGWAKDIARHLDQSPAGGVESTN